MKYFINAIPTTVLMFVEAFLICALSLPSANFTRPAILSWFAIRNEEDQLRDELRKHPEIDDAFITPEGKADSLEEAGYQKAGFTINGKEVWIRRKPKNNQKMRRRLETSA